MQESRRQLRPAKLRSSVSHPHAHPPTPGAQGFWVVQVKPGPPLGWVISRSVGNGPRYHCYAYCRDQENRRPWLREFATLNSAVAWMLQHEPEIRELIAGLSPEPGTGYEDA
jgi:hypothetical protein